MREIAIIGTDEILMAFPNGLTVFLNIGDGARADGCGCDRADGPGATGGVHYSSTGEVSVFHNGENVSAWFGPVGTDPDADGQVLSLGHLAPEAVADLVARVAGWRSQRMIVDDLKEVFGIRDDELTGDGDAAIRRLDGILNEYSHPGFDAVEAVRAVRDGSPEPGDAVSADDLVRLMAADPRTLCAAERGMRQCVADLRDGRLVRRSTIEAGIAEDRHTAENAMDDLRFNEGYLEILALTEAEDPVVLPALDVPPRERAVESAMASGCWRVRLWCNNLTCTLPVFGRNREYGFPCERCTQWQGMVDVMTMPDDLSRWRLVEYRPAGFPAKYLWVPNPADCLQPGAGPRDQDRGCGTAPGHRGPDAGPSGPNHGDGAGTGRGAGETAERAPIADDHPAGR
jgi:hypothetical protein